MLSFHGQVLGVKNKKRSHQKLVLTQESKQDQVLSVASGKSASITVKRKTLTISKPCCFSVRLNTEHILCILVLCFALCQCSPSWCSQIYGIYFHWVYYWNCWIKIDFMVLLYIHEVKDRFNASSFFWCLIPTWLFLRMNSGKSMLAYFVSFGCSGCFVFLKAGQIGTNQ